MVLVWMVSFLAALLLPLFAQAAAPAANDEAARDRWEKKLDTIIIPKLDLRDFSNAETFDFLRKEARRLDPEGMGVPIFVEIKPPEPEPKIPGLDPAAPPEKVGTPLTKFALRDGLNYMAGLAKAKVRVRADGVHIVPEAEPEPLVTREFAIPANFFRKLEEWGRETRNPAAVQARTNFQEFLSAQGATFPAGASAQLNPQGTRLKVRNTEDELLFIGKLLFVRELPPVPPPEETISPFLTRKKARGIILPAVSLKDVTFEEAFRRLGELGVRFDKAGRGVKIVAKVDRFTPGEAIAADPRISYEAKPVSLFDAIQSVAKLCVAKVKIEGTTIFVVPMGVPSDELITREFHMPPGMTDVDFQSLGVIYGPPVPENMLPKEPNWLTSGGVVFSDPSPSLLYVASNRRLIIRHAPAIMELFEEKILKLWERYYEQHPFQQSSRKAPPPPPEEPGPPPLTAPPF